MSERGGVFSYFFFFFLSAIILFQIISMVQSDRIYQRLNQIIDIYEGGSGDIKNSIFGIGDKEGVVDEGDWLVWGFRVEPKTLNPYSSDDDIYSRWITVPYIFEPLLVYDFNDLTVKPHLAESYEVSNDGMEITFRLRDDIYFSDGVPITADDVIFTYETAINPQMSTAGVANLFANVKEAIKFDELTVRFVIERPYFKSVENLSFLDYGIIPKHIYGYRNAEEFNKMVSDPVGSGPFVFEKWDVGKAIFLRRNENYWGERPKLEKIVYRFISNPSSAVQLLRSGQVDIIIPQSDQFAELVNDEDFRSKVRCLSYWSPGAPFYFIGWNQDTKFFSDRRVRLAMTHIIDREQIVSELLKGYGRVITGPFFIMGSQNNAGIEPWSYDLQKSRALLDEAGWIDSDSDGLREKDGKAFRFHFMYSSGDILYMRLAKVLKDSAAKVGIEVIAEPIEWSVAFSRIRNRDFEAMVMGWSGDVLEDFYWLFHSSQIGNGGSNYVGFAEKRSDLLLEEIRRTMDKKRRDKLCQQLHRVLHNEQPFTFLFSRPTFRFLDKRFKNVNIYRLGLKYRQWYVPRQQQRYE